MLVKCPECGHMVEVPDKLPAKRAKKKNTGVIVLVIAVIIALVIAGIGFYFYKTQEMENEQRAYENAMMSDQPAVLQNYLDMYAEAPKAHRESVEAHLTSLKKIDTDWTNALKSGSKAELEKYIMRHPNSVYVVEAKLQIDSLDWVAACRADTEAAYYAYIREHYDGAYYDEAVRAAELAREAEEARRRQELLDSIHVQDSIRAAEEASKHGGLRSILGF